MRAMRASVAYMPACQRSKTVPTFNFACQHANKPPKGVPIFQLACQGT